VWLAAAWQDWQSGSFIMKTSTVDRLASQGIPLVLDLEDPSWEAGAANDSEGRTGADSHHQPRKSHLGRLASG
jgi:hypothetical protein